jgi:hypothetical protein
MDGSMARGLTAALILSLAGCDTIRDSAANPANWFGRATEAPTRAVEDVRDPRPLIAVTALEVAPSAGGAIVEARGLPPAQGWWGADLVAVEDGDPATLTYELRAVPVPVARRVGPAPSRELLVATFASDAALAGVRRIRVDGAGGARIAAR